ncbi:MAG: multidrug efflux SMR transporter [Lentimicrobium sp.]
MAWIILIVAGLFETVWAISMKYSDGFTRLWPSAITVIAMAISVYLLAFSLKTLPLGIAYTIWTSIGALGTVIYGMWVFGESRDLLKIIFVTMIIAGIVGLRFVSEKDSTAGKTEQGQTVGTQSETGNNSPGNP